MVNIKNPLRWVSFCPKFSILFSNKNLGVGVDHKSVGELYGVQVVYPFTRANLRDVVKARSEKIKLLSSSNNITVYQASNDLSDEQEEFIKQFELEDQERFLSILTEELIAQTNAINDETSRINQQALDNEIANNFTTSLMLGVVGLFCFIFLIFIILK